MWQISQQQTRTHYIPVHDVDWIGVVFAEVVEMTERISSGYRVALNYAQFKATLAFV